MYVVTTGTFRKQPILSDPARKDYFLEMLFSIATEFGWELKAWVVLNNHYHILAVSPANALTLRRLVGKLHMTTARQFNLLDGVPGRKVWFQYWDTLILDQAGYLARLNYVHTNPVKHGLVLRPDEYRWSSANEFFEAASPALRATVGSFDVERLNVPDDF